MALTLSNSTTGGVFTLRGGSNGGRFRASVTPPPPLLLDAYPNAAAAYSLRKLRAGYTGSAISIRRLSDGALLDIGFVNNVLDTTTLLTFIGSGNGSIYIWYDQSGNGNNAFSPQNTYTNLLVIAGILQIQNSKPSISYNGSSGGALQLTTQISSAVDTSVYLIGKANSLTTGGPIIGQTSPGGSGASMGQYFGRYIMLNYNGTNLSQYESAANSADLNFNIISQYYTLGPVATMYKNNTLIPNTLQTSYSASTYNFWNIGAHGGFQTIGFISEVIIYKSNQLSNGAAINTNINSFYTIF